MFAFFNYGETYYQNAPIATSWVIPTRKIRNKQTKQTFGSNVKIREVAIALIDLEGLVRVVVKNTEFRTIRKSKKIYIIQYPQQRVFNVIDWLYSTTDHEVQNIF